VGGHAVEEISDELSTAEILALKKAWARAAG
jgi:hypothetical protein